MLKWESWMGGCGETQGANNTIPIAQLFFVMFLYFTVKLFINPVHCHHHLLQGGQCKLLALLRSTHIREVHGWTFCILNSGKVSDDLESPGSKQTCFPTPRTKTLSRRRELGNHQESSQSEKIRSRRKCLWLTYSALYCNNP